MPGEDQWLYGDLSDFPCQVEGCPNPAVGWVQEPLASMLELVAIDGEDRIFLCEEHLRPLKDGSVT